MDRVKNLTVYRTKVMEMREKPCNHVVLLKKVQYTPSISPKFTSPSPMTSHLKLLTL